MKKALVPMTHRRGGSVQIYFAHLFGGGPIRVHATQVSGRSRSRINRSTRCLPISSPQRLVHARTATGFPACRMCLTDQFNVLLIFLRTTTGWPIPPGVESAATDTVECAHRLHREVFFVEVDEGEDVAFVLEVYSMAFFKRACSIFRRSYAFFTRRNSRSSAATSSSTSTPLLMISPSASVCANETT